MKAFKALTLALLFLSTILFSQNNFKLGFTGTYPDNYSYGTTSGTNWSWYNELYMNTWQGWWIGEQETGVMSNLNTYNLHGLFQPDSLRWAGYGRMQINQAENNSSLFFRYTNHHSAGDAITDVWQMQSQDVQYYDAPSSAGMM